jgi:hypothetical protein
MQVATYCVALIAWLSGRQPGGMRTRAVGVQQLERLLDLLLLLWGQRGWGRWRAALDHPVRGCSSQQFECCAANHCRVRGALHLTQRGLGSGNENGGWIERVCEPMQQVSIQGSSHGRASYSRDSAYQWTTTSIQTWCAALTRSEAMFR